MYRNEGIFRLTRKFLICPKTTRGLRLLGAPRVRVGLPGRVPAGPLQQFPRQVHKVRLLRPLLLAEQVHLPLAQDRPLGQVRAAGRGQLQLVAAPHEAVRESAGRGGARVGGREGDVQRGDQETIAQQPELEGVAEPCQAAEILAHRSDAHARPLPHPSTGAPVPGIASTAVEEPGDGLRVAPASTGRRRRGGKDARIPILPVRFAVAGQEGTGPLPR